VLARRTLCSGKEFSQFDLVVGAPIEPKEFFDVEQCLATYHDDADGPADIREPPPLWVKAPSTHSVPATESATTTSATTTTTPLKAGSKRRRRHKRERVLAAANAAAAAAGVPPPPSVKSVSQKHRDASLKHALQVDLDAADLAHSKPAWIGLRSAEEESEDGMGGRVYTREEIEALTGARDLVYVNWLGQCVFFALVSYLHGLLIRPSLSIPIVDSRGRIIAVLGGMPKNLIVWKVITDRAAALMESGVRAGLSARIKSTIDGPKSRIPRYPEASHTVAAKSYVLRCRISSD
jgi:hypothetical protein